MQTFDYKLSITLNLPYHRATARWNHAFTSIRVALLTAIRHQNLLGWDNFLRGFIFIKWKDMYMQLSCYDFHLSKLNGTHS